MYTLPGIISEITCGSIHLQEKQIACTVKKQTNKTNTPPPHTHKTKPHTHTQQPNLPTQDITQKLTVNNKCC
jgi:hypothetical protein